VDHINGQSGRTPDEELDAYGFPSRPTESAEALANWQDAWSHWQGAGSVGMCIGRVFSAVPDPAASGLWAGAMTIFGAANTR
jgi:hypothetical protein